MSGIYGLLGLQDNDTSYVSTIGQRTVFDAVNEYLRMVNEDLRSAESVFVEATTQNYKERYKLPGGGRLQQMAGQTKPGAVKAYGAWDVAYPLKDFGAMLASDVVTLAYMTLPELQRHLDTIRLQAINTFRFEMLYALFNNQGGSYASFIDPIWGTLQVEPLANGEAGVLYPPVLGSESEATENHYLESNYAASAISDSNDPYVTIIDELDEHFGDVTGGSNIVVFINDAQRVKTEALTAFNPVPDGFLQVGTQTNVPVRLPNVPGKIIGRHDHGAWVSQWRWIPSGWMLGLHLEAPAPLKRRIDLAPGLPTELTLVASEDVYPLHEAVYRWRFGVGAANRLNGVVMEFGTGGTYSVPASYA